MTDDLVRDCLIAGGMIAVLIAGFFALAWSAELPAKETNAVHRYHARCFNHGTLIWEGDYERRGISIWAYTPDGKELFLPHDGCVTEGR